MPAVTSGKVLVSGANGYIAVWLVRSLLEKGYSVRGTVRSAAKGEHLKKLFASKYGDKFEVVAVEDITKEGAFDEAVKGVDAIAHTASPFHWKADDPQELIAPAVNGTIGIIKSVLKNGSNVKRVVITSSVAAILRTENEPMTFSESDWNDQAIQIVKESGRAAAPNAKYRASKTLAERAAWELYNTNKSTISWDLSVLNPPLVLGPFIHEVPNAASLNTSTLDFYNTTLTETAGGRSNEELGTTGGGWIDVRDLATAHILALEKEAAGGERIIISAGAFVWQDFIDAVQAISPPPYTSDEARILPKGVPVAGKHAVHKIQFNNAKAAKILELKYRTLQETAEDSVKDFVERGW